MNKFFFLFKKTSILSFLIFTIACSLAQTPQYYNYNNGTSVNIFPFSVAAGKQIQWLLLANDINQPSPVRGGNSITKLYFYMAGTGSGTYTDLTIKLGQTAITSLPAGVIYTGPMDTVYFRTSVTLSSTINTWMSITLDRAYPYDTSKSLVIDVSQCGAALSGQLFVHQTTLTPVRRNYINHTGGCVFAYSGQDGSIINCGVDVVPTIGSLCEGFNSTAFPPLGWTELFSGPNYWSRQVQSGYGLGVGSARYNMWNAPPGNIQELITPAVLRTFASSTLSFDFAYSPYPASPPYFADSLIVFSSTDGGTTWTAVVSMGPVEMQTAPAGTSEFTPTSGQWGRTTVPLPNGTNKIDFKGKSQFGNDLFIDSICIFYPVGIKGNQSAIPKKYSLSQNYPNPFNPTTKIEFALPKSEFVNLIVYDILGAQVATLVNENMQAGIHTVNFKGDNLASGVYFYKIKAGDFTNIKKMVLLK